MRSLRDNAGPRLVSILHLETRVRTRLLLGRPKVPLYPLRRDIDPDRPTSPIASDGSAAALSNSSRPDQSSLFWGTGPLLLCCCSSHRSMASTKEEYPDRPTDGKRKKQVKLRRSCQHLAATSNGEREKLDTTEQYTQIPLAKTTVSDASSSFLFHLLLETGQKTSKRQEEERKV